MTTHGITKADVTIKPLESITEMKACVDLQQRAFGWTDLEREYAIPDHLLKAATEISGVVLGAFAAHPAKEIEDKLIGFLLALPRLVKGEEPGHLLHIMGVDPEWRSQGVGFALFQAYAQVYASLSQEVELTGPIVWTYDPWMSANANLYLQDRR